jgi:hypothetical protein
MATMAMHTAAIAVFFQEKFLMMWDLGEKFEKKTHGMEVPAKKMPLELIRRPRRKKSLSPSKRLQSF